MSATGVRQIDATWSAIPTAVQMAALAWFRDWSDVCGGFHVLHDEDGVIVEPVRIGNRADPDEFLRGIQARRLIGKLAADETLGEAVRVHTIMSWAKSQHGAEPTLQ